MRLRSLFTTLAVALAACTPSEPPGPSDPAKETYAASLNVDIATMTKVDNNLYYKDIVVGPATAATATHGKVVTVIYNGFLVNGTSFTSGTQTTDPTALSDVNFIAGWVLGIPGMKVGGKRKLVIGSSYGYGSRGSGPIPGNATLIFDVELKAMQ